MRIPDFKGIARPTLLLVMALLLAAARGNAAVLPANLAANGDFADGVKGWQWEQWLKERPLPGVVDPGDRPAGSAASFRMGLPGATGARDFYLDIKGLTRAGRGYLLTFWLKPQKMAPGAAHVRLSRGYGSFLKSERGEADVATTGGTQDWREYRIPLHPWPDGPLQELMIHFIHDWIGQGTLGISGVSLRAAAPEELERVEDAAAGGAAMPTGPNLITNGSFGEGLNGWGYEQWRNRPVPGVVDTADHAPDAPASFKMGLPGTTGGRWMAREVALTQPNQGYLLTFWVKTQGLPGGAAYVRVGREGRGWLGSETGRSDVLKTGGTHDWRQVRVPIPARDLGASPKLTLFFYNDAMGQGTLGISGVALRAASEEQLGRVRLPSLDVDSFAPVLTGDTGRPEHSTFVQGQKVELTFHLAGGTPSTTPLRLLLGILDEHDRRLAAREVPVQVDADGEWQTTVEAPSARLGFYRVKARLSDGTVLAALGSRPAGFLTYIVVPDPARRKDYGEGGCRFAMQGSWGEMCALLGVRWVLDDALFWRRTEPERSGQFGPEQVKQYVAGGRPGSDGYRVYTLPTLFVAPGWAVKPESFIYETGTLTPAGEKAWAEYCRTAARAYAARYPERKKHIYQITWEPIQPWGFKGTFADLVRIYQIAYTTLHEVDPGAVVAGPCRGLYNNGDPEDTERLLKAGLARYLDAYIAHPYYTATPEKDGMPQAIRRMKAILRAATGKELPMYGSEQGYPTDENVAKELEQAQVLLRQNLITLGEGFQVNFAFTHYDYRMGGSRTGYGYYYNLDKGVPFGPKKVCPKPIAAAYAAQSLLLEGSRSVGAIEWLGKGIWGYAFQRAGRTTLALWRYGGEITDLALPTGVGQVHVFDWMGNERVLQTQVGMLPLKIGPEPVYVSGVSNTLWGAEAAKLLTLASKRLESYPGGSVSVLGKVLMAGRHPSLGALRVTDPAGWLSPLSCRVPLGSARPAPFRIRLKIPPSLRPGVYPVHVCLYDSAGRLVTAAALTLNVAPPVAVRVEAAFLNGGKPALVVTLGERRGRATSGRLEIRLKQLLPGAQRGDAPMIDLVVDPGKAVDVANTRRQVPFALAAGGRQRLVIGLPGAVLAPARQYQALAAITPARESAFQQTAPVHFFGAEPLAQARSIDGDPSDWGAGPAVVLSGPQDVVRSPQYFPKQLSARMRYAWDARSLYLVAEVEDDLFVQNNTGAGIWSQDCLQLAFNLDARAAKGEERRTSEINVALTKNGPEAYRSLSYSLEKLPEGTLTPAQLQLAVKRIGAGKPIYEMAIPWATLGMPAGQSPRSGDVIGVAATVNEVRSATQQDPCALGLFGGITPEKNPDRYGLLTLE